MCFAQVRASSQTATPLHENIAVFIVQHQTADVPGDCQSCGGGFFLANEDYGGRFNESFHT